MFMDNAQPSGFELMIRIDELLSTEQKNILGRERVNEDHIHLYNLGGCWAAFDRSAFLVKQMVKVSELPEIFELHDNPFPLVMHILDEKIIQILCKGRFSELRNRKHIQLAGMAIDSMAYNSWYKETVYESQCIQ